MYKKMAHLHMQHSQFVTIHTNKEYVTIFAWALKSAYAQIL